MGNVLLMVDNSYLLSLLISSLFKMHRDLIQMPLGFGGRFVNSKMGS